jgi:hypothetical protein
MEYFAKEEFCEIRMVLSLQARKRNKFTSNFVLIEKCLGCEHCILGGS